MNTATLLVDPEAIRLAFIRPSTAAITLVINTKAVQATCPRCHRASRRVHSRYVRRVADLSWQGVPVRLELHTRRFRRGNGFCVQRIFCERLPSVVAHYARKTVRLNAALELIGFALGGESGSRLATEFGLIASPDTLLRRVRQSLPEVTSGPRIIGVDDFAYSRGRRYGTLLVDLELRRPIDLLPDRQAETLSSWLKAHQGIQVVSRDRSRAYANGVTGSAPDAIQVADRWHLLKNLREALGQLLKRLLSARRTPKAAPSPCDEHERTCAEKTRIRLLPHLLRSGTGLRPERAPPLRPPPPREAA